MGRGKSSKAVRQVKRAVERGNAMGGTQHGPKGKKWSRKDVVEARKALATNNLRLSQMGLNTAQVCDKTLREHNKAIRKNIVKE
tara:strand:- start:1494 stop:1745 length:252 start_codon:yes stop_codon:yes gene_type:complete